MTKRDMEIFRRQISRSVVVAPVAGTNKRFILWTILFVVTAYLIAVFAGK